MNQLTLKTDLIFLIFLHFHTNPLSFALLRFSFSLLFPSFPFLLSISLTTLFFLLWHSKIVYICFFSCANPLGDFSLLFTSFPSFFAFLFFFKELCSRYASNRLPKRPSMNQNQCAYPQQSVSFSSSLVYSVQ